MNGKFMKSHGNRESDIKMVIEYLQ